MIVRRAIYEDIPAVRVGFSHLIRELERHQIVKYPVHDSVTLDDFTVHLAGRVGQDPRFLLYVALEDDTRMLLGFLGGEIVQRLLGHPTVFGSAHWLYVVPGDRGRGVARALVRLACEDLQEAGITHVELASLQGDDQWARRGWFPYLTHYVLPLDAVIAGAQERPPRPAEPPLAPAEPPAPVEIPVEPEPLAAVNGNEALDILAQSVDVLELSVRPAHCLLNADIQTLGQLVQKSKRELLRTKNFGKKSLAEVVQALEQRGLSLRRAYRDEW